jgi:hypothetical protein
LGFFPSKYLVIHARVGFELAAAAMNMGQALFLQFNSKLDPFGFKAILTKESFHGILYLHVKEGVDKMWIVSHKLAFPLCMFFLDKMWIVSHKLAFPLCMFFLCDVSFSGKRVKCLVEVGPMVIDSGKGRPKGKHTLGLL